MPRNIELKVAHCNIEEAARILDGLGARFSGRQIQLDTSFHVRHGRLKLREILGQEAMLIWYHRPDEKQFRNSLYGLVPVPDPAALKAALIAACGVRGQVSKTRDVYLYHNVRVHLDTVENLGQFIEFEAVLSGDDDETVSRDRLEILHGALEIDPAEYCAQSYVDLMGL